MIQKPPFKSILSDPPSRNPREGSDRPSRCYATTLQGLPVNRQTRVSAVVVAENTGSEAENGQIAALNEAIAPDQEWTRIAPYRAIPNAVGLQVFDPAGAAAMVAGFNSVAGKVSRLFRGLPVYVGHPDDPAWLKQNPGHRAEAVGRVKALEARDDGLYGKIAFNDEGKRLVSGEAAPFAFHSPRWGMRPIQHAGRPAFQPVLLYSLGLTNNPNISDNAIGLNELSPMKTNILALLAALGRPLAADSTDEQLAAAVNEALAPAGQLSTLNAQLSTLKDQLASAQAALTGATNEKTALGSQLSALSSQLASERGARAELVLATAINEGRITAAQRSEWLGKLTANGADFTAVAGQLKGLKKAINTKSAVAGLGERKAEANVSRDRIAAINEAVNAEKAKYPRLSHLEAFAAVQKGKPELFATAVA